MVLLRNFINIFKVAELKKKVLFTLGVLIIYRLGIHIPVVGVNIAKLQEWIANAGPVSGLLSYLDMFSGGALAKCTIFALGITPYITSSIMMQMLGMTIPHLEQLLKEGEYGRKIINQYTRYLTFVVSLVQSFIFAGMLERGGFVVTPGWGFRLMFMLSLTVGSMFVMWLGEQITLFGIGNGSSLIIFAGIVARFPSDAIKTVYQVMEGQLPPWKGIAILVSFVVITACIVFLEKGSRKIPVQYTRRIVGQRVYGGQSTYIPFKINTAGVMPAIFASSIMQIPLFLISFLSTKFESLRWLGMYVSPMGLVNSVLMFLLIIFFSFFYTALVFNPEELADNIKKSGGFIPGIRPGKKTAEFFNYILTRVGLVGAIYLGILALLPNIMIMALGVPFMISGTALLIAVGVSLDTAAQIESYLIEHRYEGFLSSGRITGRRGR